MEMADPLFYCYHSMTLLDAMEAFFAFALQNSIHEGNLYLHATGYEQSRVLKKSLTLLLEGVEQVRLRSDTARYQHSLLQYCKRGEDPRFGRTEFAVGADVTPEFKKTALTEVGEKDWQLIYREFEEPSPL
jgi:hypothetical protein